MISLFWLLLERLTFDDDLTEDEELRPDDMLEPLDLEGAELEREELLWLDEDDDEAEREAPPPLD